MNLTETQLDKEGIRRIVGDLAKAAGGASEDAFWTARPELEHVRTFARARLVSPYAVLGVVLTRVTAATEYQVHLPSIVGGRASLNLAVGLVGESGDGKGGAEEVAKDALSLGERMSSFATWKLGSGQGLAHGYAERQKGEVVRVADSCLFRMDEVDHLVGLAGQRGSTLLPELRSALMGEALGHLYVDSTKRVPVAAHSYRLCLTLGIQPKRAGVLLDDTDGGTPQRIVWLPTTDPGAPEQAPDEPRYRTWRLPEWPSSGELPVWDGARSEIVQARQARNRGEGDPLDGHRLLLRLKLATALDALSGSAGVSEDGWELAGHMLAVSDHTRSSCVSAVAGKKRELNKARAIADGERAVIVEEATAEGFVQRVARLLLAKLESGPKLRGELRRSLASRDRGYFDPAIERLVGAGQIRAEGFNDGTRYSHV